MMMLPEDLFSIASLPGLGLLCAVVGGGITIGSCYDLSGIKLSLLTVGTLVGVNLLENTFKMFQRGVHRQLTQVKNRRRRVDGAPSRQWSSDSAEKGKSLRGEFQNEVEG